MLFVRGTAKMKVGKDGVAKNPTPPPPLLSLSPCTSADVPVCVFFFLSHVERFPALGLSRPRLSSQWGQPISRHCGVSGLPTSLWDSSLPAGAGVAFCLLRLFVCPSVSVLFSPFSHCVVCVRAPSPSLCMCVCVCARARARVRVCVCVCVWVSEWERKRQRQRGRERVCGWRIRQACALCIIMSGLSQW